jgi:hypothetical protein
VGSLYLQAFADFLEERDPEVNAAFFTAYWQESDLCD